MRFRIELMAEGSSAVTPAHIFNKALNDINVSLSEDGKDAEIVEMNTERPPSPLGVVASSADLPPEVLSDNIPSESIF